MTAADIKKALRKRHPARVEYGNGAWIPGPWTTIEEWMSIDFLAFSAWMKPSPARVAYSRIGYEVKVSRADYRRELLNPMKRQVQVAFCHEFYFAVPDGMLNAHEIAWEEPEWARDPASMSRARCTAGCYAQRGRRGYGVYDRTDAGLVWRKCGVCGGKGHLARSRVEEEAPTLWIPADVGLLTVSPRGCRVVRKAPIREPHGLRGDHAIAELVRWVSLRPDPRHARSA